MFSPLTLTPPWFSHCRWICYTLWKSKARLRHRHLYRPTRWWVLMPFSGLLVLPLCKEKRVYRVIFSVCFFFFLEGKIIKQFHLALLKHWFLVWNKLQTPCVAPPNWQQHLLLMIKGTGKLFTKLQSSLVKPTLSINKEREILGVGPVDVWFDYNSQFFLLTKTWV